MELTAPELWSRILESVRSALPEQSFRTWFAATEAVAVSGSELVVEAPSDFHVEWIEDKYGPMLAELAQQATGRPLGVRIESAPGGGPPVPAVELATPEPAAGPEPSRGSRASVGSRAPRADPGPRPRPGLNERYTFDRFVVGNNNQLAAAACHAVAENPARMYNPLFLYGGVGLGKTHLMHAVGNQLVDTDGNRRVMYVSSEQFTNDLVSSIQNGSTADFRRRYRRMDLLLVDDVHFLGEKERTQEEFFHTFNALYDAQKQIVLTSDRPPKEIPGLEDRLVSRFEWGLVADIKPPDYETRVAILRKKASDDHLTLDHEVMDFIARACTASVRELEGAVIKLLAYSSLTNQEVTVELARTALTAVLGADRDPDSRERLTPERIRAAVAEAWGVEVDDLTSRRRTREVTEPRQVAMYLIRDILDLSLVQIGELFGGRDHSTVIHSVKKVEGVLEEDPDFRATVQELRADLTGASP
jgi:chromosomal replication initiator protein